MSKGFAVYPITKQTVENVINEELIRECIFITPVIASEEEKLRVVSNRDEATLQEKTRKEIYSMPLHKVETLIMSFRKLSKIDNLYGLRRLTKLCLDNNRITKMENLNHLITLTWLDLSFNAISIIEGIDALTNLQSLSLYSNKITKLSGLDNLCKLSSFSIGENPLDSLDDVTRYLHKIKSLKVLTLRNTPLESMPHYRVRVLAFIPTLTFFNGHSVQASEIARAREDQRENLLPVDEEDERELAQTKANAEAENARVEYEQYNCPNEMKLCEELNQLAPDGHDVMSVIRSDLVIAASKETLDRFQSEFNEAAKELTESMRNIKIRRDKDNRAYHVALEEYNACNTKESRKRIHEFEQKLKMYIPKQITVALTQSIPLNAEVANDLHADLQSLQTALIELEAEQFNAFEALHNGTLNKWKSDGVDVLLQSAFENFFKLEGDFQTNLRHAFDALFEQRQKRERNVDDYYFSSKQDESIVAIVDNKEEYQKLLNDWSELRRKYLESLEMQHLKNEEELLAQRVRMISDQEQERHRTRLVEIASYIDHMSDYIDAACDEQQG